MPLPGSLQLITLTGTFLDSAGLGKAGTITVQLREAMYSQADNTVVPPFSASADLDAGGSFSLEIPATNDPDWLPTDVTYLITAQFSDYSKLWWDIPIPYDAPGNTFDLADAGAPGVGSPNTTPDCGGGWSLDGGYKGAWVNTTLYRIGDTVQYGSTVYGALRSSTGVIPGTSPVTWKVYPSSGGGGGAVSSVFGRTGDVVSAANDYALADITGLQAALDGKQPLDVDLTAIAGLPPTTDNVIQSVAGVWASRTPAQLKSTLALVKGDVGLGNVDNTSDANKPISTATATALAGKEPTITAGTTGQYWRGDKSWQTLDKTAVGLANVDNTSDAGKPISTATQTALNAKADLVGGVIPTAQIPAISIIEYLGSVASQAAMLALSGQKGDWAIRSDLGTTWIITGSDPTQLASWTQLSYPTAPVTSVNGQTGVVVLNAANVGAAATSHVHAGADITSGTVGYARLPVGTTASTVAAGDDSRLSDTRTPTDGTVTTAKIVDSNVTLAKIANISASTILGNNTAGAAAPIALTAAQTKTLLAIAQSDVSGLTSALALLAPLASPTFTGTVTHSGRVVITPDTLTDAATIAVDASLGNDFTVTLGGNRTLGNPTNATNGQKLLFAIRQDGTGSRTLTLDTAYRLGADITAVTLSTGANKTDYIGVRYNATDSKWDVIAFVKGY